MSTALTPAPRTLSCNLTESDIATLLSSIFTTVTLPSPTVSKNVTPGHDHDHRSILGPGSDGEPDANRSGECRDKRLIIDTLSGGR